jgi:hypothetical protein
MAITADDKDWTWVLERPCPECGFDAAVVAPADAVAGLRENAAAWRPLLERSGVATRPAEDRWSALEYGCHVRDVFRRYDQRVALMLAEDDPMFPNWDQDATAVAERYGEQDPSTVAAELGAAGQVLTDRLDTVSDHQWERCGTRSDGAHFTIASLVRYLLHDPVHHVWDVEQGYATLAAR